MPTFETPEPVSVTLELVVGDIQIAASERADTVVEVRPSDPAKASDVATAEQTGVEYANDRLVIKAPRIKASEGWRQWMAGGHRPSIDVQIDLPSGSRVQGEVGMAALRGTGRLGECRYKTGIGDIQIDQAGPMWLRTGGGDITVHRVIGHAEITTGTGAIQVDSIDGTAVVKNSNGDTLIGGVAGDLRVNAANGKIAVDQAHGTVAAKTANGGVRVSRVAGGEVLAETAYGKVDIGIMDGVAAWLDLNTGYGNVHNDLESAERPATDEGTVEVRARTAFGDITVRRCLAHAPAR